MRLALFSLIIFCLSTTSYGQDDYFQSWNENYKEIDTGDLLAREKYYADSIENDPGLVQFYVRQDGYRFIGRFTGKWRKIEPATVDVMKMVYKFFGGSPPALFDELRNEVEIGAGDRNIWMPIQHVLEKPFRKELHENQEVYIYALFLNLHSQAGELHNIFLISEFIPQ